jgi:hypothetical protein
MSRHFVLSPVAMRYWLPPIGAIGNLLERFCCEFDLSDVFYRDRRQPVETPQESILLMTKRDPEDMPVSRSYAPRVDAAVIDPDARDVLSRLGLRPRDVENVSQLSTNLLLISDRAAPIRAGSVRARLGGRPGGVSDWLQGRGARRPVVEDDSMRRRVSDLVGAEVDRIVTAGLDASLERVLSTERFDQAVEENEAVKSLRSDNRKLKSELRKVTKELERLARGDEE